jgi:hypothetical protein
MLLTLLTGLGGGLLRLMPELIGWLNKKTDYSHELAMADKQLELAKFRGQDERETRALQGDVDANLALIQERGQALQGQMQKTGWKLVDAMNFLVRPVTTYYFLGCYGIVKTCMIIIACRQTDPWTAIIACWAAEDGAMLWGILNFWFVGRVFDKK